MDVTVSDGFDLSNTLETYQDGVHAQDISIEVHMNFLALGVVCSIAYIAAFVFILYCCSRACSNDGNQFSCSYERTVTQDESRFGTEKTVCSGSASLRVPAVANRRMSPSNKSETILEQSEEYCQSHVYDQSEKSDSFIESKQNDVV